MSCGASVNCNGFLVLLYAKANLSIIYSFCMQICIPPSHPVVLLYKFINHLTSLSSLVFFALYTHVIIICPLCMCILCTLEIYSQYGQTLFLSDLHFSIQISVCSFNSQLSVLSDVILCHRPNIECSATKIDNHLHLHNLDQHN